MKQDGAYSLLEPGEFDDPLADLSEEFENLDFLDTRVSTYASRDTAYNGALLVVADEKLGHFEKGDVIEEMSDSYDWSKGDRLVLRYEGSSAEGFYYSVADTLGRDSLDAS